MDFDEISFLQQIVNRNKIKANEVIDVGVRAGTPSLYRAFPKADFLLVDPQKGGDALLQEKPLKYEFLNVGLGSSFGTAVLNEQGGKSSVLDRTSVTAGKIEEKYEFEVVTLDSVINEKMHTSSIGIKIDTEGYELEVIKGLNDNVDRISFIIAEASVRKRFLDSYSFDEFIMAMKDRGFLFYTIVSRPNQKPFHHDVLFLPASHHMLQ